MTLRAVIFDCDGLLADTETPDFEAWRMIYAEHGLPFSVEDWAQNIGMASGQGVRDWHGPLAEIVGPGYDRNQIRARRHQHYQSAIEALRPMPGVVALLDTLDAEGVLCAVATNAVTIWVERVLRVIGLRDRFTAIATVDQVENPKPAPDVYLLAAKKLGVPPNTCAALEDSPRGLAAAHAAGMFAVAVPTALTRHLDFPHARHLVESLEHLTVDSLRVTMGG
jgi:putative hydrolase of the HAD superfamily